MNTLIILAHPQLEKSVANKFIVEGIKDKASNITVRDIFALYPDYKIDIEAEQTALLEADNIVFQFPFYWYSMPAILKAWFDEVFNFNFAYGPEGNKLKGKNFITSITVGGPKDAYHPLGYNHFKLEEFLRPLEQTAYLAQMNYISPIYTHGMVFIPGVYNTKEVVEERAYNHVSNLFKAIQKLSEGAIKNKIETFVKEWFSNFDRLSEGSYFHKFLMSDTVMEFPEGKFIGFEGFDNWYEAIKNTIKPDNQHIIESIDIQEKKETFEVHLSVKLIAEQIDGTPIQLNVKEAWKLIIQNENQIKIKEYLVQPVKA